MIPGRPWGERAEEKRLAVKIAGIRSDNQVAIKLPNLAGITSAIDKLTSAIEDDARKLVERDVPLVEARRSEVMAKARARLGDRRDALEGLAKELDKLDAALGDNSGEARDTGGSS